MGFCSYSLLITLFDFNINLINKIQINQFLNSLKTIKVDFKR